jgi:hypothetical protein
MLHALWSQVFSYFDLYEEIQKRGLPIWIDCPDFGGGSAIERGVG